MVVCLFGVYRPTREFFTHMPLPVKGCIFFTYARHSWPLSSEGSLTCHTHCDTGIPFIKEISEDPWHSHLLPSVCQWSSHNLFLRLRSVATRNQTPILRMRGERSTSTPPRRSIIMVRRDTLIATLTPTLSWHKKWVLIWYAKLWHATSKVEIDLDTFWYAVRIMAKNWVN